MDVRGLALASLTVLAATGCKKSPRSRPADAARARVPRNAVPPYLLLTVRGASLRAALPIVFGMPTTPEVLRAFSRELTPGIAAHSDQVDVDAPFATVTTLNRAEPSAMRTFVAWPLRPDARLAQDARALRGYRVAADGLYAPIGSDAGAAAVGQCWVGLRAPSGAMLLCGPRQTLPQVASYLRDRAMAAPENAAVVDAEVRVALVRRVLAWSLAALDRSVPPASPSTVEEVRERELAEQERQQLRRLAGLAADVTSVRAVVTQDGATTHLRAEMGISRATSAASRAVLAATLGQQAAASMLTLVPATVQSWIVAGFDRARFIDVFGVSGPDPEITETHGADFAHVMAAARETRSLAPLGPRVDGFVPGADPTVYHVIHRPDAVQFVQALRAALNNLPARRNPAGRSLRDEAAVLPTPGLVEPNALRFGSKPVAPGERAMPQPSTLLIARGDELIVVASRDPVASYRAMARGARANARVPPGAVLAGRVTAASLPVWLQGELPDEPNDPRAGAGIDFALGAERRGEGARFELRADGPTDAVVDLRQSLEMLLQDSGAPH